MPNRLNVNIQDRVISVLSYITAGWAGIILLIFFYFAHIETSKFTRFNVFQSVFISFVYFIFVSIMNLLFLILSSIPFIQIVSSWLQLMLYRPVLLEYSLLQIVTIGIIVYCVAFSIMGRYPLIYKVSELINKMCR